MKEILNRNKYSIIWLMILSCIYLNVCPLSFNNVMVGMIVNQIPYVLAIIFDVLLIYKYRKNIYCIFNFYFNKNKVLFVFIFLYIIYDFVTIFYSMNPLYSIQKYFIFAKTLILAGSLFLCMYEEKECFYHKNIEWLIKSIGWLMPMIIITLFVKYNMGMSWYVRKLSLIKDYNVFSNYMLYTLIIYLYYRLYVWEKASLGRKIGDIVIINIAISALYLSGSRRIIILCPIMIGLFVIYFLIDNVVRISEKRMRAILVCIMVVCVLIANIKNTIPTFEKYLSGDLYWRAQTAVTPTGAVTQDTTYLSTRYETVNEGEGLASRNKIWRVILAEIKDYNKKELIFGKGDSYGWLVYENVENEGVLDLLNDYSIDSPSSKWMSPHSLFFKEMLEGGIVKIILLLLLAITLLFKVIEVIKDKLWLGFMFLSIYTSFAGNYLLGGTYGLIGEDLFWLTTVIVILCTTSYNNEKKF